MRHTISALVENKPGVLVRIAGLFARRGFNIEVASHSLATVDLYAKNGDLLIPAHTSRDGRLD